MDKGRKELVKLRVAVARVAQAIEVDNKLGVTGKNYNQLYEIASEKERGWHSLCAGIVLKIEGLVDAKD